MTTAGRPHPRQDTPSAQPRHRRRTTQQQAVLRTLRADTHFRSAQRLHLDLHQHHHIRVGLTTIYRILQTFTDQHLVESQRAEDGEILYRLRTEAGHHHHLLCRRCGRAIRYAPRDLEDHVIRFATGHGFTDITHHIDLYGTCPQCAHPSAPPQ